MENPKPFERLSIFPYGMVQFAILLGVQAGTLPARDEWRFALPIFWPFFDWTVTWFLGWKSQSKTRAGLIATVLAVTALAEFLGTNYGLYGAHYHYIDTAWDPLLKPWRPLAVPFLWLAGAYPLTLSAGAWTPGESRIQRTKRTITVATGMLLWDLLLDPLSVREGKWAWTSGHPIFQGTLAGVPIENFLAWWTGVVILHQTYEFLRRKRGWRLPSNLSAIWIYLLLIAATAAGRH